jgi:hypothetical protein
MGQPFAVALAVATSFASALAPAPGVEGTGGITLSKVKFTILGS